MEASEQKAAINQQVLQQLAIQMAQGNKPDLAKAFVEFWNEIGNVEFDAKNPFHKNQYASLQAVLNKVKPVSRKYGLAFPQMLGMCADGSQELITQVMHTSGQMWTFKSSFPLSDAGTKKNGSPNPPGPQQGASASSYLRRYTLMALCGICGTEDDDGQTAQDTDDEEDDTPTVNAEQLKKDIEVFTLNKRETLEDGLERMTETLEARVKQSGDGDIVKLYVEKRKAVKKAAK